MSSSFEDEIIRLRKFVADQLRARANEIVEKEIQDILGRIKIITTRDLSDRIAWIIERTEGEMK